MSAARPVSRLSYGDIVPLTNVEYIVTASYMIIGGVIWAYLIGSLTTIVTNLNHHQAHFKHIMAELNCASVSR